MNGKLLNILTVLSSLLGYLQWGRSNSMFLFKAELDVLTKLFQDPTEAMHPLTLLPLLGQLLLLITLLQKSPNRLLTWIGIGALSSLLGFMFFIGILGLNLRILVSTLPFFIVVFFQVKHLRSQRNSSTIR